MSLSPPAAAPSRRYDLDWLRILAFALLVFYHVGMFYVPWGWHVKSVHAGPGAEPLMMLVNPWRLSLLFFISGVAFAFLHKKLGAAQFARVRVLRLMPVIIFGMVVVVMPQTYFQLREMGEIEPGILAFWPRYLTGWEIAGIEVPTWNHLWYVVYLLVYAVVLAPLLPLLNAFGRGPARIFARAWESRFGPVLLVLLGFIPLMLWRVALVPHFETTHNLVHDWANHVISFTFVLYGVYAARSESFWRCVDRALPLTFGLAVILGAILTPVWMNFEPLLDQPVALWAARAGRVAYAWVVILALLGLARRFLNHDSPVRRYLTEAIFPVYVLHQTITVSAGYALTRTGLDVWTEFTALTVITFAGSFAGFEIIRRIAILRPLFGLKRQTRRPAADLRSGAP